jgi:hypothetical protein
MKRLFVRLSKVGATSGTEVRSELTALSGLGTARRQHDPTSKEALWK